MTTQDADPLVDLGWGNGWGTTPPLVEACIAARLRGEQHDYFERALPWACCHEVVCRTCGYRYSYDSGD